MPSEVRQGTHTGNGPRTSPNFSNRGSIFLEVPYMAVLLRLYQPRLSRLLNSEVDRHPKKSVWFPHRVCSYTVEGSLRHFSLGIPHRVQLCDVMAIATHRPPCKS
eukprot:355935-Chlamydomonas_euryale.AAC.4